MKYMKNLKNTCLELKKVQVEISVLLTIWGTSRPREDHTGISALVLNVLVDLPDSPVQKKAGSSGPGSSLYDIAPRLAKAVNSAVSYLMQIVWLAQPVVFSVLTLLGQSSHNVKLLQEFLLSLLFLLVRESGALNGGPFVPSIAQNMQNSVDGKIMYVNSLTELRIFFSFFLTSVQYDQNDLPHYSSHSLRTEETNETRSRNMTDDIFCSFT